MITTQSAAPPPSTQLTKTSCSVWSSYNKKTLPTQKVPIFTSWRENQVIESTSEEYLSWEKADPHTLWRGKGKDLESRDYWEASAQRRQQHCPGTPAPTTLGDRVCRKSPVCLLWNCSIRKAAAQEFHIYNGWEYSRVHRLSDVYVGVYNSAVRHATEFAQSSHAHENWMKSVACNISLLMHLTSALLNEPVKDLNDYFVSIKKKNHPQQIFIS